MAPHRRPKPIRWLIILGFVGLVGILLGTPAVGAIESNENDTGEVDTVLLDVNVDAAGDAAWIAEYRYVLDSDAEAEAFEALAEDIETNRSEYETRYRDGMLAVLERASESTSREMSLSEVQVSASTDPLAAVDGEHGVVTYEFVWENFASVENGTMTIGDAIHGFYLSQETRLVFRWPTEFDIVGSATPSADAEDVDRVVWEGEHAFLADEPDVELTKHPSDPQDDTDGEAMDESAADDTETADPDEDDDSPGVPVVVLAVAFVFVLGVVGAGGFVAMRRAGEESTSPGGGADGSTATAAGEPAEASDGTTEDLPPPELMSNEERVLTVLEQNGGRIKQKDLAEKCDWHASKTSKVVTNLKDEGAVDVFRIGRENILTRPGETLGDLDDEE